MSNERDGDVSTNGARHAVASEPPSGRSVEERLAALMDVIQAWDWRAAPVDAHPSPATEGARTDSALVATAPSLFGEESGEVQGRLLQSPAEPIGPSQEPREVEGQPLAVSEEPVGAHAAPAPVPLVEDSAALESTQAVPVIVEVEQPPPPIADSQVAPDLREEGSAGVTASPVEGSGPKHVAEGRLGRLWAHRWTKLAALCILAAAIALLVIQCIRFAHENPGSNDPTPTSVTQPASTPTAQHTTPASTALPVTAAQLAQYNQYAAPMEAANATTNAGLSALGDPATVASVTPLATTYLSALKLYNLQIHYLRWPASVQADVGADETQLTALMNFVQSVGALTQPGVNAWVAQLRALAGTTQTADNKVRHDLGLASSSVFP